MLCPKCGRDNPDSHNYCPNCGTLLKFTSPENANSGIAIGSGGDAIIRVAPVGRDKITQYFLSSVSGLGRDVPFLEHHRPLDPLPNMDKPMPGIEFTDRLPQDETHPPSLYLSIYFNTSPFLFRGPLAPRGKWLFIQADMRPALKMRIQASVFNNDLLEEFMNCLRGSGEECKLLGHSYSLGQNAAPDLFYLWRENNETRLMLATFTPTYAGISVHARMSLESLQAFAEYLDEVGFTKPFHPL